jgi:hypothetical protein
MRLPVRPYLLALGMVAALCGCKPPAEPVTDPAQQNQSVPPELKARFDAIDKDPKLDRTTKAMMKSGAYAEYSRQHPKSAPGG